MGKLSVAQCYTGEIGSEIIRRLGDHPKLELVGVLVHSEEKRGRDSGELVGAKANGVITTTSLDDIIALKPHGAIWSGAHLDLDAIVRLLDAGINVYAGMGGNYFKGLPEEAALTAAATRGRATFGTGGNIPGLISDVLPLFVSGYTGRITQIRAWQRNHSAGNPSTTQLQRYLCFGKNPEDAGDLQRVAEAWARGMTQSARLIADAIGVEFESFALEKVETAVARERAVLPASGLVIEKGTIGGIRFTMAGRAGGREFYRLVNEQTGLLGLGKGWRAANDEPAWRVEIDGDPPVVCTFGWPSGTEPGIANSRLNSARALNVLPRLIAAPPGLLTMLDYPAPVASDGLAPI